MIKKRRLRLYRPHPGQVSLHRSDARFRVAVCGRRWGKTLASTAEITKSAWEIPGSLSFWVAPVYRQSMIAFNLAKGGLPRGTVTAINKVERNIRLINGSVIEFKSAEIPQNLRGFGIDFLVVDEAAFLPRELWEEVLRPALSDREGKALFVGTPKGKNWFFELFCRGRDPAEEHWGSFTFPTTNNPYIKEEEVIEARKSLCDRAFRQEYMAQFVEDADGVFFGVTRCVGGELRDPVPGGHYFAGLDIGRRKDYTVLAILDSAGRLVHFDRLRKVSWGRIKRRMAGALKKYNRAVVWVDSTGVGDPIVEDLTRMGVSCRGFRFTLHSKAALVEHLALAIEEQKIQFPSIPELIDELLIFEARTTPHGNTTYGAPGGYHDDCVISLALAWWGMRGVRVSQADFETIGF
jgi:hypothetical protein